MANILWSGREADKLYLTSGVFSTFLKSSADLSTFDNDIQGCNYDGTNVHIAGDEADKLYHFSGLVTATLKTSQVYSRPYGAGYSDNNPMYIDRDLSKLYEISGIYSTTYKQSVADTGSTTVETGISYDGTNTPWSDEGTDKLVLYSGKITTTIKDSLLTQGALGEFGATGMSADGIGNTYFCGDEAGTAKQYHLSGQFSSTVKTSIDNISVDADPRGIDTSDYNTRVGISSVIPFRTLLGVGV